MFRKIIDDLKKGQENPRNQPTNPVKTLDYKVKRAEAFATAVNEVLKDTWLYAKYQRGGYQHFIAKSDELWGYITIGYKKGDKYLLEAELVYNKMNELAQKERELHYTAIGRLFCELLMDGVIKPYWKPHAALPGHEAKWYICIPGILVKPPIEMIG